MIGALLTPEEQTNLTSIPIISCPDAPRLELAIMQKQALSLSSYNFKAFLAKTIRMCIIETL